MAALRELARQGELRLECPAAGEGTKPKLSLELDCGQQLTPADALTGAYAISRSRDHGDLGRLVLSYTPAVPQAYFPVAGNIEVLPALAHPALALPPTARRPPPVAPSWHLARLCIIHGIYTAWHAHVHVHGVHPPGADGAVSAR